MKPRTAVDGGTGRVARYDAAKGTPNNSNRTTVRFNRFFDLFIVFSKGHAPM
jgi:hypothetical protein